MTPSFSVPSVIYKTHITNFSTRTPGHGELVPALLERVAELGSLRLAVAELGLDEDLAWNYLVAANNLSDQPLIRTQAETLLPTHHARGLLGRGEEMARAFQGFLGAGHGGSFIQFQSRHQFLQRLAARTSARNQFHCQVLSVRRERVNAVVNLDMGGGDRLTAHITTTSAEALGLVGGRSCYALVDPGWVEVGLPDPVGRRPGGNVMTGRVVRCLADPVDTEVTLELAGGRMLVACMSQSELANKAIRVGSPVQVLIQASQIILAVEGEPTTVAP